MKLFACISYLFSQQRQELGIIVNAIKETRKLVSRETQLPSLGSQRQLDGRRKPPPGPAGPLCFTDLLDFDEQQKELTSPSN